MKNIPRELWFGNIYPAEDALKMTPEMKDLGRLVERKREDLMSTLTEQQKYHCPDIPSLPQGSKPLLQCKYFSLV